MTILANDISLSLNALTSKLLFFIISELGSKSIETPFVTSDEGIFYRTTHIERLFE